MVIGILKEPPFETRVSLLAVEAATLIKGGHTIWVEQGAGLKSFCLDDDYKTTGAEIKARADIFEGADFILGIHYKDVPEPVKNKTFIFMWLILYP